MHQTFEKLEHMKAFTQAYKNNNDNIYRRESACIDLQCMYEIMPIGENDLIAGKKTEMPIGFSPQPQYRSVGYYCDNNDLLKMKNDPTLSEKERSDIDELISFWSGKTTKDKILARYTDNQKEVFAYRALTNVSSDLFRMSGSQMDPTNLLKKGISGLIEEIEAKRVNNPDFYDSVKSALLTLRKICLRYKSDILHISKTCTDTYRNEILLKMSSNLEHIAYNKPDTFWQAIQLFYLFNLFSGSRNYGRMDEFLGDYYANDIDNGVITEEFAFELIMSLWNLIAERNYTMDARVILGGKDRRNIKNADRFALAAIEATRQSKEPLPQLTLRCYNGMNETVYQKALECIGEGTTYPILYNDEINIAAVQTAYNLSKDEAQLYVPYGCGEYVIYNKSFATPSGAINLLFGLNQMLDLNGHNYLEECDTFEMFYDRYLKEMEYHIEQLTYQEKLEYDVCGEDAPFLFFSILFDDCLERGLPLFSGGIRYLQGVLEAYGNTNTTDSLTAIKTLIYEQKTISPKQLSEAIKSNFVGYEDVRKLLLAAPKFGNDDPIADDIAVMFHNDICHIIRNCAHKAGLHSYLMVVINNETNVAMGHYTGASADGRLANTYMANANNPVGGMDKNGITAMINSLLKLRPDYHAGSAQNMRFSKEMFEKYMHQTKGLLKAYFDNGGTQTMITVLNRGDLENAMIEPDKYRNLIVRVGGFSARFVELSQNTQKELLSRTLY